MTAQYAFAPRPDAFVFPGAFTFGRAGAGRGRGACPMSTWCRAPLSGSASPPRRYRVTFAVLYSVPFGARHTNQASGEPETGRIVS